MIGKRKENGSGDKVADDGSGSRSPRARRSEDFEEDITTSGKDEKDSGTEKDEVDSDTEVEGGKRGSKSDGRVDKGKAGSERKGLGGPFGRSPASSANRDYSKKEANAAANQFNFYERACQTYSSAIRVNL
jgi:hypothetical protein